MKKFLQWIEKQIDKLHRCENHEEVFSKTYEEYNGFCIQTGIHTKCSVCGKTILRIGI